MVDKDGQPNAILNWRNRAVREVDELIGLCKGVVSDGTVNENEARFLERWLQTNRNSREIWPCSVLFPRIASMLVDGKLSSEEEHDLLDLLIKISGGNPEALDVHSLTSGLPLDQPAPNISFQEKIFCFTGKMLSGPRADCEHKVIQRGGAVTSSVSRELSFLVIGTIGSRDWLHSTFGRKIEKAVDLRGKGLPVRIVSEEQFVRALD